MKLKKATCSILLLACLLTGCKEAHVSDINSKSEKPNPTEETTSLPAIAPTTSKDSPFAYTEIKAKTNYIVNDNIQQGSAEDIIAAQGTLTVDYPLYDSSHEILLGADSAQNLYVIDWLTYDVHRLTRDGDDNIILKNILGSRDNDIQFSVLYGDYIAWSERPYATQNPDPTNGVGWALYCANLKTGAIVLVEEDIGVRTDDSFAYGYLCPTSIALSNEYIAYTSFEKNSQNSTVQVLRLYHIPTGKMETPAQLEDDPSCNAIGYPSIDGDMLSWCNGFIRSDGLYDGCISYMDLKTKTIIKLDTTENVINPCVVRGNIFGENKPNETYYDSEIVIYEIDKKQWRYKINDAYSKYQSPHDNPLVDISKSGHYATWQTFTNQTIIVFDVDSQKLYQMVAPAAGTFIRNIRLLPGNLLVWEEEQFDAKSYTSKFDIKYLFLK